MIDDGQIQEIFSGISKRNPRKKILKNIKRLFLLEELAVDIDLYFNVCYNQLTVLNN